MKKIKNDKNFEKFLILINKYCNKAHGYKMFGKLSQTSKHQADWNDRF